MGSVSRDVRQGLRMLSASPGFTVFIVLTLALGIGANSAIFSVVDTVLFKPLPFGDPDRVAILSNVRVHLGASSVSASNFLDWRDQVNSFELVGAYYSAGGGVNLTGEGEAERVRATEVSQNYFQIFDLKPLLGRFFLPEEAVPGRNHVAVLSYGLWRTRFGSQKEIVGRAILLDGREYNVVGIAPAEFRFPASVDIWTPAAFGSDSLFAGLVTYQVIGRLRAGATNQQARAELMSLPEGLRQRSPGRQGYSDIGVIPIRDHLVGNMRIALSILFGIVGIVLTIACVNVTNLLVGRGASRQREMAIRIALGAGRRRLTQQLIIENTLLALLGGVAGSMVAAGGLTFLKRISPPWLPNIERASVDRRVLAFTLAVSILVGLVLGFVMALRISKPDVNEVLKRGSASIVGLGVRRLQGALVVGEVGMALVLLVGSGLLTRSLGRLREVNLGFNPKDVLTVSVSLPGSTYPEETKRTAFFREILDRIRLIPQVKYVGATSNLPLSGAGASMFSFTTDGEKPGGGERSVIRHISGRFARLLSSFGHNRLSRPRLRGTGFLLRDPSGHN